MPRRLRLWISAGLLCLVLTGGHSALAGRDQDRAAALSAKSEALLREGRTDESLPYLRRLLELQPHNDNARYALGLALLFPDAEQSGGQTRERLLESVRLLAECARRARGVSESGAFVAGRLFYLAVGHWRLGNAEQALGLFEQVYLADFTRNDAIYNRFAIFEELGRTAEARLELQRYLELKPSSERLQPE